MSLLRGVGEYVKAPLTTLRVREPGIETNRTYELYHCNSYGNVQWFATMPDRG
jgi:hypothetical protein